MTAGTAKASASPPPPPRRGIDRSPRRDPILPIFLYALFCRPQRALSVVPGAGHGAVAEATALPVVDARYRWQALPPEHLRVRSPPGTHLCGPGLQAAACGADGRCIRTRHLPPHTATAVWFWVGWPAVVVRAAPALRRSASPRSRARLRVAHPNRCTKRTRHPPSPPPTGR